MEPWERRCSHFHGQNRQLNIELYWTIPWSPVDFSHVRRDALDLWPKAEVARGEAVTKNARKKLFAWVIIPETVHKMSLGTKGNWPLFWKRYIDGVFFLWKTSLKTESLNRGKGKKLSHYSYYQIHRWDIRNRDPFLGHKSVQRG